MLIITKRTQRTIFVTLAILTSCMIYEGDANEVHAAIEEQLELRHHIHMGRLINSVVKTWQPVVIV